MNKTGLTAGRVLIMVGFTLSCFGLLLFLWLAFGGPVPLKPKGYRFEVSFAEGSQIAQEADVRISGVPVGKVKTVESNPVTGRSKAVVEMEERFAPLPKDSRAILRQKTLLGETYIELTPGNGRRAGFIPRTASCPTAGSRRPSSSTRSSAPSIPTRASRSRSGCSRRPAPSTGVLATSTTCSATSTRSRRTPPSC
jgi:ABC-type transporter Mla subunit MlaD